MFLGLRTAIYASPDLQAARDWYTGLLGYEPYFDQPFYVGFNVGGFELGLVPDPDGSATYWGVTDLDKAWKELLKRGAEPLEEPKDVGEGIRVAIARSPQGHRLGIIFNPHFNG